MEQKLQNKLCSRFPLFFRQKDLGPELSCMCWGICTGDGWYNLIYLMCLGIEEKLNLNLFKQYYYLYKLQLMESFQGAIAYFQRKTFVEYEELLNKRSNPKAKVSWKFRFNQFFNFVSGNTRCKDDFSFTQIKEKFGTLRAYHTSSVNEIEEWINFMEIISAHTCEECGNPGKLTGGSWVKTICEECNKKENK